MKSPDFDETLAQTREELEAAAQETLEERDTQDALHDAERDDAW